MVYFAIAVFGVIVIIRMLLLGGATADGQGLRRDENPAVYWSILSIAVIVDLLLLYFAYLEFTK